MTRLRILRTGLRVAAIFGALLGREAFAGDPPPWLRIAPPRPPEFPELWVESESLPGGVGWQWVDIRSAESYRAGHVPLARWLPLADLCTDDQVACLRRELGERGIEADRGVVLYGEGGDLARLGRAFLRLERAGHRQIKLLDGGFESWRAAGRGIEVESTPPSPTLYSPPPAVQVEVSRSELFTALATPAFELLDVRDRGDWTTRDFEAPTHYRAGHLPSALPFDPESLLESSRGGAGVSAGPRKIVPLRSAIADVFSRLGARRGDHVDLDARFVLYGENRDDPSVGLGYLLLRTLGLDVGVLSEGILGWRENGGAVVEIVSAARVLALIAEHRGNSSETSGAAPTLILDLREKADFDADRVLDAHLVTTSPTFEALDAKLRERWPSLDRERTRVIFYCYGRDCIRSRAAAAQLARCGFRDLFWFRGGMEEWRKLDR